MEYFKTLINIIYLFILPLFMALRQYDYYNKKIKIK